MEGGLGRFHHEALVHAGDGGFLAGTLPLVTAGVRAGEPVLVVVGQRRIDLIRRTLGPDAGTVQFADMEAVGGNPGRIIPVWRQFVDDARAAGHGTVRGVGEPVYPERGAAELVECGIHEALLNVAFGPDDGLELLCPYDRGALSPEAMALAHRTHPVVREDGSRRPGDGAAVPSTLEAPLPEPPPGAIRIGVDRFELAWLRRSVSWHGARTGLRPARIDDLVRATEEVAVNSVRHGGGSGTVFLWRDGDRAVVEVRDAGVISDPLAGRVRPRDPHRRSGLWLANQRCDLVQLRSSAQGTRVRLHVGPR